jgi:hypothetical protein
MNSLKKGLFAKGWLVALLVACSSVTVEAARIQDDCWKLTGGTIHVDFTNGSWSVQALCFERRHNLCPEISSAKYTIGVDTDDNGVLDPGEPQETYSSQHVGNQVCIAATSGNYNGPAGDVIVHYEVHVEGQDEPVWSKDSHIERPRT